MLEHFTHFYYIKMLIKNSRLVQKLFINFGQRFQSIHKMESTILTEETKAVQEVVKSHPKTYREYYEDSYRVGN